MTTPELHREPVVALVAAGVRRVSPHIAAAPVEPAAWSASTREVAPTDVGLRAAIPWLLKGGPWSSLRFKTAKAEQGRSQRQPRSALYYCDDTLLCAINNP